MNVTESAIFFSAIKITKCSLLLLLSNDIETSFVDPRWRNLIWKLNTRRDKLEKICSTWLL